MKKLLIKSVLLVVVTAAVSGASAQLSTLRNKNTPAPKDTTGTKKDSTKPAGTTTPASTPATTNNASGNVTISYDTTNQVGLIPNLNYHSVTITLLTEARLRTASRLNMSTCVMMIIYGACLSGERLMHEKKQINPLCMAVGMTKGIDVSFPLCSTRSKMIA